MNDQDILNSLIDINKNVASNDAKLSDLQLHFNNHLQHHEKKEEEIKKYCFAMLTIVISSAIAGTGSFITGLILLLCKL